MKPFDVFEIPMQGISLVEAGAGTGKTYSITSVYVRALLEINLRPANILVLTFTNAATAELKARIFERLVNTKKFLDNPDSHNFNEDFYLKLDSIIDDRETAKKIINRSIYEFEEAAIFTLHGFCQRVIEEFGSYFNQFGNFDVISDQRALIRQYTGRFFREFNKIATYDRFHRFVLEYLWRANKKADSFPTYVASIMGNPAAKPVPEVPLLEELESVYDDLNDAFVRLRKEWSNQKKYIIEDYEAGTFKKNIYRDDFSELVQQFDAWLSRDAILGDIPEKAHLFTAQKYYDSVKTNKTATDIPFLTDFEHFLEQFQQLNQVPAAFLRAMTRYVGHKLQEEKRLENLYSYDDLISSVRDELVNKENENFKKRLIQKFPVALLDEFQDTDTFQYDIFSSLYHPESKKTALFMIGDPKQAIYGFRGADVYTYLKARKSVSENQVYSLTYNYRSVPGLIEAVNELFEQSEHPFLIDDITFEKAKAPAEYGNTSELVSDNEKYPYLTFYKAEKDKDIPVHTAQEIANMLQSAEQGALTIGGMPVQAKDICVLVRTSAQGESIHEALNELGVKSILKSNRNIFDTEEAIQLYFVLQAVAHPSSIESIKAALATPLIGWDAEKLIGIDDLQLLELIQQFRNYNELWQEKGIQSCMEAVKSRFAVEHRLASLKHGERAITNLNHLEELLVQAGKEHHFGMRGLLKWFLEKRKTEHEEEREEELIRLESDENLVQISTMHGSKGLEYSIVILPFLLDPPRRVRIKSKKYKNMLFHNPDEDKELSLYLDDFRDERTEEWYCQTLFEEIAESVRLQYVALTRAKQACIIYYTNELHPFAPLAVLDPANSVRKEELNAKSPSNIHIDHFLKRLSEGNDRIIIKNAEIEDRKTFKGYKTPEITLEEPKPFLRKNLSDIKRVSSYSSVSGSYQSSSDTDTGMIYDEPFQQEIIPLNPDGAFINFPGGRAAGSCLHDIMELIDFQQPAQVSEIVQEKLKEYNFEPKWEPTVEKKVKELLNHYLDSEGSICLRNFRSSELLKEMEFHFSVESVPAENVFTLIRGEENHSAHYKYIPKGYLKGFIDLIFRHQNRYYILDYKSNYLGPAHEDYDYPNLKESIIHSDYDLQYYLYTIALHRFLKSRISEYNYNKHFGGVFYVYMRGTTDIPGSGVYFDNPSFEVINTLDDRLAKGEMNEA